MKKQYTPSMVLQDSEQIGSFGLKDPLTARSDADLVKPAGLQPTYTVTGFQTEVIPPSAEKMEVKVSRKIPIIDEKQKQEAQRHIALALQAQRNYAKFIEKYRQDPEAVDENGFPVPLSVPPEFLKYADQKCKKCFGRGVIGWSHVLDVHETYHRNDKGLVEPIPCRCIAELIETIATKPADEPTNPVG